MTGGGTLGNYRYRVLGFICLLGTITYLDQIAISVSGPQMQQELSISPEMWGWVVVGIFTVLVSDAVPVPA